MRCDILLAGVGGQGVLTAAALIAGAAVKEGWTVKQSEEHGMAQRGGSVTAHLRIADGPVWSDVIARGGAHLILSAEPLEALRHLGHLAPDGAVVSASEPFRNIPVYPDEAELRRRLRQSARLILVDAERLAKEAGLPQAQAVVLVGAAEALLPLPPGAIEEHLREAFAARPPHVIEANIRALRAGREAARALRESEGERCP